MEMFEEIAQQESNENTALILMLGIINDNLIKIQEILTQNKPKNPN